MDNTSKWGMRTERRFSNQSCWASLCNSCASLSPSPSVGMAMTRTSTPAFEYSWRCALAWYSRAPRNAAPLPGSSTTTMQTGTPFIVILPAMPGKIVANSSQYAVGAMNRNRPSLETELGVLSGSSSGTMSAYVGAARFVTAPRCRAVQAAKACPSRSPLSAVASHDGQTMLSRLGGPRRSVPSCMVSTRSLGSSISASSRSDATVLLMPDVRLASPFL